MLMSITLWNVAIQKLNQLMRQSHLASKIDKNMTVLITMLLKMASCPT